MRLVRDVFTSFPAFPVAARSTVPALLFHFPAGRVNNEICPVPLFSGLHKQLILLSRFSLNYTLFSGDHTEAVPGAGVFGAGQAAWIRILNKTVLNMLCPLPSEAEQGLTHEVFIENNLHSVRFSVL